jgi:hypothetical protein
MRSLTVVEANIFLQNSLNLFLASQQEIVQRHSSHCPEKPFHDAVIFGMDRACGVEKAPMVFSCLAVRPVDHRVVEIGFDHATLEIIEDYCFGYASPQKENIRTCAMPKLC